MASAWPPQGVGKYLGRGFTPQKPLKRAYEQRPEAVQAWLSRDLFGNCPARQGGSGGDSLGGRDWASLRRCARAFLCAGRQDAPDSGAESAGRAVGNVDGDQPRQGALESV